MPRKDGKRFKGTDMMYTIAPHIMDKRCDACNSLTVYIPYEPMHDYIVKKRAEGIRMSHMSLIISAYVRTVAKFPAVNRFVVNKRIYSRNDLLDMLYLYDIEVSLVEERILLHLSYF